MSDDRQQGTASLTVSLLAAFVANNSVRSDELPGLVIATYRALSGLSDAPSSSVEPETLQYKAVVSQKTSIADPEFILSMIDGKRYKFLKRHLASHELTAEQYRSRYNLPPSYPMVAPGYSKLRSDNAKALGLGRKPLRSADDVTALNSQTSLPVNAKPVKRAYTKRAKVSA